MEHWLAARGYKIVQPTHVTIKNYCFSEPASPHQATSVDANVPCILEKLFGGTVSVRVISQEVQCTQLIQKTHSNGVTTNKIVSRMVAQQKFLFVRNVMDTSFIKKDIMVMCDEYVTLAKCIVIASGIPPMSTQLLWRKGAECGNPVEILAPSDIVFAKPICRRMPNYTVLNTAQMVELTDDYKIELHDLPRLPMTDAASKYYGFRPGDVVRTSSLDYRIVTFSGGGGGEKASDRIKRTRIVTATAAAAAAAAAVASGATIVTGKPNDFERTTLYEPLAKRTKQ